MKTLLLIGLVLCLAAPVYALKINEFVANDVSTDDAEFIELVGDPGMSLNGYWIVLIEGEGTGKGVVDNIINLNGYTMPGDGYFVMGDAPKVSPDLTLAAGWIENGGNNIILFQGTVTVIVTTDIDTNDDCVADLLLGTGVVVDAVGYGIPGGTSLDCITYYGAYPLGPDGTYDPAGGAICCTGWEIICLTGTETAGGTRCADPYKVGWATPHLPNDCFDPSATEATSWGGVKALYR